MDQQTLHIAILAGITGGFMGALATYFYRVRKLAKEVRSNYANLLLEIGEVKEAAQRAVALLEPEQPESTDDDALIKDAIEDAIESAEITAESAEITAESTENKTAQ